MSNLSSLIGIYYDPVALIFNIYLIKLSIISSLSIGYAICKFY